LQKTFKIAGVELEVDLTHDAYGESMWGGAGDGVWECATLGFVLANSSPSATFFDFGAASGVFTLLAAKRGANVVAVEPHPIWLKALHSNVGANDLSERVKVVSAAISSFDGELLFEDDRNRRVVSDSAAQRAEGKISVISLEKIVSENPSQRSFFKIDIEGAEYGLLLGGNSIETLSSIGALVFLSIHPGFSYQGIFNKRSFLWLVNSIYARSRGIWDNLRLFKAIQGSGTVALPNGRLVRRAPEFALLAELGVHDFVINFSNSRA